MRLCRAEVGLGGADIPLCLVKVTAAAKDLEGLDDSRLKDCLCQSPGMKSTLYNIHRFSMTN